MKQLEQYHEIEKRANQMISEAREELKQVLFKQWDTDIEIKQAIDKLYESENYWWNACGEIRNGIRIDIKIYSKIEQELLKEYFGERHSLDFDSKNNVLSQYIGEDYIIISYETNDVYQYGKLLFNRDQYKDKQELFNLINQHQEKSGVYGEVFLVHRYGELELINTLNK